MSYKFTFKAQKVGVWDMYKAFDIKYRGEVVGCIRSEANGEWSVRLIMPASEKALAANPNCPWSWATIKKRFESAQSAKDWLNENRETLLPQLYRRENGSR